MILVPGLMAFKAWDDHDRSDLRTAEIIAKNILDQCDQNAILITSGDNVSFPLWYMQEVENYRTDVRVIEYNLLGLHWFTDKLRKKMNDSEALKLSIPSGFYKRHNMGTVPLGINEKLKGNIELQKLVDYIPKVKKDLKVPSDLFQISIDTNTVFWKSIDAQKYGAKKTNKIQWQLRKTLYSARDIAMFDILSNNYGERPVYFSNTGRAEFNMGLESFFLNKGTVNQLLPIVPISRTRLIDANSINIMVSNPTNYENLSDEDAFTPDTDASFAKTFFLPHFYDLAYAYSENKQNEEALTVLRNGVKMIPNSKFPYDSDDFKVAQLFLQLGDIESWKNTTRIIMKNEMDKLRWYTSFSPVHEIITYEDAMELGKDLSVLMNEIASVDGDLVKEFEQDMISLDVQFMTWKRENDVLSKRK